MSNNIIKKPEKMDEFFNARVTGYDQHMKENIDQYEDFYRTISKPILRTDVRIEILDLGCGTGLELKGIFKNVPNAQITGIDLSEEMLNSLTEKYREFAEQLNLIKGSYISHPFGREKYDYVVSVMTIHHFFEKEKLELYKKIRKSLKPDGKYIEGDYVVSEKEEKNALLEYESKIKLVNKNQLYHIDIPMTEEKQIKLLEKAGFSKVEVIFRGEANRVFVATV